jgi:hypothetical protein
MQPGYAPPAGGAPIAYPAAPALPGPATPAASPFAAPAMPPVQPAPAGWGAAGADVPQQLVPGQPSINPPALPATGYPPVQVVPQAGTYAPQPMAPVQPQPTAPPALAPAPSLKPIPELPRTTVSGTAVPGVPAYNPAANGSVPPPSLPSGSGSGTAAPFLQPSTSGTGSPAAGRTYPRLLAPTSHTTSWQPAVGVAAPAAFVPAYPTAALPARVSR